MLEIWTRDPAWTETGAFDFLPGALSGCLTFIGSFPKLLVVTRLLKGVQQFLGERRASDRGWAFGFTSASVMAAVPLSCAFSWRVADVRAGALASAEK